MGIVSVPSMHVQNGAVDTAIASAVDGRPDGAAEAAIASAHHCHQFVSKKGRWPDHARPEAGLCGPSPIRLKAGDGHPMGRPDAPAKSGGERSGPSHPAGGRRVGLGRQGGYGAGTLPVASFCHLSKDNTKLKLKLTLALFSSIAYMSSSSLISIHRAFWLVFSVSSTTPRPTSSSMSTSSLPPSVLLASVSCNI